MDLKKKFRDFFTLSRKGNGGFTLVELIVVIAILAILGGVAVPAYSGYVKKAELAADEALLREINTAFASACAVNGEDHYNRQDNPALADSGNGIGLAIGNTKIGESFDGFFDSKDGEFKVMTLLEIDYNDEFGGFKYTPGRISVVVNGVKYTADAASVEAFLNSTLGQLGTSEILGMVNTAVGGLGVDFATGALPAALSSNSYKAEAAKAMGLIADDADQATAVEAYEKYIADKTEAAIQQYYKDNNIVDPGMKEEKKAKDKAKEQIDAMEKNMVAVVGASKSEEAAVGLVDILKGNSAYDTLHDNVYDDENSALGISQSALAYALYSSYASSAGKEANGINFVSALQGNDEGFKQYLADTERVNADLEGAKGAMNVVGDQDSATLEHSVINGVGNPELEQALQQLFGK